MSLSDWRGRVPGREVLLRYISSGLAILALILLYVTAVQGSGWSPVILIFTIGAFVARMFVGPTEEELRAVAGMGKVVGMAGRFIRRRTGKIPPPFDCHSCGARNAPEFSETDICEYCGAAPAASVPASQPSPGPHGHDAPTGDA